MQSKPCTMLPILTHWQSCDPNQPVPYILVTSKWAFIHEAIMVFFSNYVGEWEITSKVGFDFLLAPPPPTTLVPTPLD